MWDGLAPLGVHRCCNVHQSDQKIECVTKSSVQHLVILSPNSDFFYRTAVSVKQSTCS